MSIFKLILGIVSNVAIFGVSLFLPAGTLEWWRAWVFLGVVLVLRIWIDEEFLRRELKGYEEYTKKVRYRLIPFLW